MTSKMIFLKFQFWVLRDRGSGVEKTQDPFFDFNGQPSVLVLVFSLRLFESLYIHFSNIAAFVNKKIWKILLFFLNIVKEFLNVAIFFIVLNKWLYQVLAAVISGRNQVIQFISLFLGSVKEISIRGLFYRKKKTSGSVTLTISS